MDKERGFIMAGRLQGLFLIAGFILSYGPGFAQDGKTYEVRGVVIDARTGSPLSGANVSLLAKGDIPQGQFRVDNIKSATDGSFTFKECAAGSYELRIALKSYVLKLDDIKDADGVINLSVGEGTSDEPLECLMYPVSTIRGRVTFHDGRPVPDAEFHLMIPKAEGKETKYLREKSDRDGHYVLSSLPPLTGCWLQIHGNTSDATPRLQWTWLLGESRTFDIPMGATVTVDVQLPELALISGRVLDSTGNPLTQGTVAISVNSDDYRYMTNLQVPIGTDGTWQLPGIIIGKARLSYNSPGYITQYENDFPLRPGINPPFEAKLERSYSIEGTVFYSDGKPAADVKIGAYKPSSKQGFADIDVDKQGHFKIGQLKPATYDLRVSIWYADQVQKVFPGYKAGTQDVKITLDLPGHVHGQVLDASTGQPINQYYVTAHIPMTEHPKATSGKGFQITDPEGRFSVDVPAATRCFVVVSAKDYQVAESEPFAVLSGTDSPPLTIRMMKGFSISGRVVSASDNKPITNVSVSASNRVYSKNQPGTIFGSGHARTDEEGVFHIAGLASATYSLEIDPGHTNNRYLRRSVQKVPVSGDVNIGDVKLVGSPRLVGMLYDAQMQPATKAYIAFVPVKFTDRYSFIDHHLGAHVKNGRFELKNAPAGRYRAIVEGGAPDGSISRVVAAPEFVDLATAQVTTQNFTIPKGYQVKGKVKSEGIANEKVQVHFLYTGRGNWQTRFVGAECNKTGAYAATFYRPGEWTAHVTVGESTSTKAYAFQGRVQAQKEGSGNLDLNLGGIEFSGQVLSPTGGPLPYASVMLMPYSDSNTVFDDRCAYGTGTQKDGRFRMKVGEPGTYLLEVDDLRGGVESNLLKLDFDGKDMTDYTINTFKSQRVEIKDAEGETQNWPQDYRMTAIDDRGLQRLIFDSGTGLFGNYSFVPGAYTIELRDGDNKIRASGIMEVKEGEENKMELKLKP